ncbi:MAG: PD-(D/E)XK nuclease family protein [Legionellales bacterium]|nr:PD-(D/E)XK nuclease family protein [Legionellales bacterium]
MSLYFKEEGHIYKSINDDGIDWVSVTSFINMFKPKFNSKAIAKKSSTNKNSKWYGLKPEDIIAIWDKESKRAIKLGNWYHNQREADILEFDTIERNGIELPIIRPIIENDLKLAPKQKLSDGVYPEHFVYLKSAALCGQADLVEVVNGVINITDYKTNKEIKTEGYTNWEGVTSKMYHPVAHLDDCHLKHYNLQLSIYAYIINRHNPKLKVGNLTIQHVKFKQTGVDDYGYPITLYQDGEPVIDEIVFYELPYLKAEVLELIKWLKMKKS